MERSGGSAGHIRAFSLLVSLANLWTGNVAWRNSRLSWQQNPPSLLFLKRPPHPGSLQGVRESEVEGGVHLSPLFRVALPLDCGC